MIKTEELMRLIFREGIVLEHKVMKESFKGVYYSADGLHAIFINSGITDNHTLYRSVLAEELGHHFTSIGDCTPLRCMSYQNRLSYDRNELSALRWAAEFLMPTDELMTKIATLHPVTLPTLASIFGVEAYLVLRKLEIMAGIKHTWYLQGGRTLVLTNLPDVYLYETFQPTH